MPQYFLIKTKIEQVENFLKGKSNLKITDSYPKEIFVKEAIYHATILFDFETVIDGYPYIKVKGARGAIVDVNYTPYLIDGTYAPATIVNNFSDRIVLSGNLDDWLGSEIRTLRYMAVTVRSDKPVEFEKIGIRVTEYPFEMQEAVAVKSDPFIQKLWTATKKHFKVLLTMPLPIITRSVVSMFKLHTMHLLELTEYMAIVGYKDVI